MAPAAGCPAEEIFVTFVMALSPGGPEDQPVRRRQEQPPRRGRRSHSWLPLSPSRFPRALSAGHTYQASREVGRVPPRRPKRRPLPKVAAIQRSPRGRYLLLLSFRLGQRPVIHRAHPSAPSGRAADALGHTTNEAHYQRQASLIASFGSSYESPATEATRPTRLFKGPRNKNRTRYGTSPLVHDRSRAPPDKIWFVLNDR